MIQTKEEILMYAAAMLYAENKEFPYELQWSDETVKTLLADITNVTVARKSGLRTEKAVKKQRR